MDSSQSDKCERKSKSRDSDCSRTKKVRVIVANPQLNFESDSSIIFRPWEDMNQRNENQFGAGNKAGPSHQVEPETEKNPQQVEPEAE